VRSMSDRVTFRKMIQATVLLMAAGISYAGTIVDLAPEADAILVGSITSHMESDEIVSFTITVDRILEGESIPTVIHVEHPWQRKFSVSPSGSVTIEQGLRGIWLLRQLNPNGWDALGANGLDGLFHSLYWPAVKVLPEQYQYPPGTSLNDALTFETAAGAQVSGNPEVLLYAVESLSSPAVETVLTGLLQSSTGRVRWVALAGLLGRAQAGSLDKVLQEWPAISQDAQSESYVLGAMDTDFRPQEPEAVHEVVALVQANTTRENFGLPLRRFCLRSTHERLYGILRPSCTVPNSRAG
jgi:hypothetical protein